MHGRNFLQSDSSGVSASMFLMHIVTDCGYQIRTSPVLFRVICNSSQCSLSSLPEVCDFPHGRLLSYLVKCAILKRAPYAEAASWVSDFAPAEKVATRVVEEVDKIEVPSAGYELQ
eukprot:438505-Amphidinium_carterae.1